MQKVADGHEIARVPLKGLDGSAGLGFVHTNGGGADVVAPALNAGARTVAAAPIRTRTQHTLATLAIA